MGAFSGEWNLIVRAKMTMIQMPIDSEKYFYHFTKSETALIYILPNLSLKLTNYLKSNDPKENKTFGFWSIYESCDEFKLKEIKENFEIFLRKNCKHLCFSMDYQNPQSEIWVNGFDHPTMWAHYGDNSKGICLAINKEIFLKENPELIHDRVSYEENFNFPQIDEYQWTDKKDDYFKEYLKENSKLLFFRKHKHWEVEHEYKFIEIGHRDYCTIKTSLSGIYLGLDFDFSQLNLLRQILPEGKWIEKVGVWEGRFMSNNVDMYNTNNN